MSKVAAILRAHELARVQKVRRHHTHVATIAPDEQSRREYEAFCRDFELDELTIIPDRLGKTGEHEPKSIYSPAPPSKFQRIAPRKRNAGEKGDKQELDARDQPYQPVTVPQLASRRHKAMVNGRTLNVAWERERR